MTQDQIRQVQKEKAFPEESREVELIETHISWVLLTERHAYKIKKPLQFSFLDFSTLDKRRYYCRREVELNSRLAGDIYLQVLPVREFDGKVFIGGEEGIVIDYAVQMKRMASDRRMDLLLDRNEVSKEHVRNIAMQLAAFHARAEKIAGDFNLEILDEDFADIRSPKYSLAERQLAPEGIMLEETVRFASRFLAGHAARFRERARRGFIVNGHGDLHSGNIFLLEKPVIFDCIEFSDHLRQVDVLNEIAFFSMDLEFYGHKELEAHFLETYLKENPCIEREEDWRIFYFYKWYRANVRLKINALGARQAQSELERRKKLDLTEAYLQLFGEYYHRLQYSKNLHPVGLG